MRFINSSKGLSEQTKGNPDQAFIEADVVIEGEYGIPVITHCCLEPHGQVIDWKENSMTVKRCQVGSVMGIKRWGMI